MSEHNLSSSLPDIFILDPKQIVDAYLQTNSNNQYTKALRNLLDALSKTTGNLQRLINELLAKLPTDSEFYKQLFRAAQLWVEQNPWHTAFLIIGIVLMLNPVAAAGFGSLGPQAGSIAAAWQAAHGGTVAAGSAFSILQSWGMLYHVLIPVTGAAVVAGVAATATLEEPAKDTWAVLNAGGEEAEKWGKGDYGSPVNNWWSGAYGAPVSEWWSGKYGNPATDWAKRIAEEKRKK